MTANHEHTPTGDRVRAHYYLGRQQFEGPLFPADGMTEIVAEFDRWYQAEIAAAEQRGAVSALRDAAIEISILDGSTARGFIWSKRDSIVRWLRNRADRIADQMEGDDA